MPVTYKLRCMQGVPILRNIIVPRTVTTYTKSFAYCKSLFKWIFFRTVMQLFYSFSLSSIRRSATPWTYFLHLSLSSAILIDSSRIDVVHPGRAWSSSPAWGCVPLALFHTLGYLFLRATPLFPHDVTSRAAVDKISTNMCRAVPLRTVVSICLWIRLYRRLIAQWLLAAVGTHYTQVQMRLVSRFAHPVFARVMSLCCRASNSIAKTNALNAEKNSRLQYLKNQARLSRGYYWPACT